MLKRRRKKKPKKKQNSVHWIMLHHRLSLCLPSTATIDGEQNNKVILFIAHSCSSLLCRKNAYVFMFYSFWISREFRIGVGEFKLHLDQRMREKALGFKVVEMRAHCHGKKLTISFSFFFCRISFRQLYFENSDRTNINLANVLKCSNTNILSQNRKQIL